MGRVNVKLNSVLSFDSAREADIVNKINCLTKQHKLGRLVSDLLRVYFDNPSIFNPSKGFKAVDTSTADATKGQAQVEGAPIHCPYGVAKDYKAESSLARQKFFNHVNKQVEEMQKKIDNIQSMTQQLLTLVQFNRAIGLEEKTETLVLASFLLQQQLYELEDTLGVDGINLGVREKYTPQLEKEKQKAEETLQFIINTYGDIFSALQSQLKAVMAPIQVEAHQALPLVQEIPVTPVTPVQVSNTSSQVVEDVTPQRVEVQQPTPVQTVSQQDEYLDFGDEAIEAPAFSDNADMDLMNRLLGNT